MKKLLGFVAFALAVSVSLTSCDNSQDPHNPYDSGYRPKNSQLNTTHSLVGEMYGRTGVVTNAEDAQGIVFAVSKDGSTAYLCSFTDVMVRTNIRGWFAAECWWSNGLSLKDTLVASDGERDSVVNIKVIRGNSSADGKINTDSIVAKFPTSAAAFRLDEIKGIPTSAAAACREYCRAQYHRAELVAGKDPLYDKWKDTKGEWYLPSAEELDALMKNRKKINTKYMVDGVVADTVNTTNYFMAIGGEIGHAYWSSTEFNPRSAWYVLSEKGEGTGFPSNDRYGYFNKTDNKHMYVRPIRKVSLQ